MTRLVTAPAVRDTVVDRLDAAPGGSLVASSPTTSSPTATTRGPGRRALHPWAWWGWALAASATVSLTTNLALLALCLLAVVAVVLARRTRAPWARAVRAYLWLGAFVVGMRMLLQVLLGSPQGGTVLFTLPELRLPSWLAGLHVGGPVDGQMLWRTLGDSVRLAAVLVCVGAANTLANPRRALRHVPAALHEVATAVVIALGLAPQLVESAQRIRRAHRLRSHSTGGLRSLLRFVVPVMEDAIDRSMALAASMEARGYGRTRQLPRLGAPTLALLLGGMVALVFGTFALLAISGSALWAPLVGLAGLVAVVVGLRTSGRRLAVSHYRPDPWALPETLTVGCGLAALALVLVVQHLAPDQLVPLSQGPGLPPLHPLMPLVPALLFGPALLTPAPGEDDL